jgi:hypothetical protein
MFGLGKPPNGRGDPPAGHQWGGGSPEDADDVDRLFARLAQLPPPRDFGANVMGAVHAYCPGRLPMARATGGPLRWALADLAAVIALGLLAFVVGQTLAGSGTLDLLDALASDAAVLGLLPGEALLALLDTVPWLELAGLALMLVVVRWCTRGLTRALADPRPRPPYVVPRPGDA